MVTYKTSAYLPSACHVYERIDKIEYIQQRCRHRQAIRMKRPCTNIGTSNSIEGKQSAIPKALMYDESPLGLPLAVCEIAYQHPSSVLRGRLPIEIYKMGSIARYHNSSLRAFHPTRA